MNPRTTIMFATSLVAVSIALYGFLTCTPSAPYPPAERLSSLITARVAGPLYQGNFYK